MFEDATTGSWWQQETGEAVAGTLAGRQLSDVPSMQMKLGAWIEQFPATLILQADPDFQRQYDHLKGFDEGTIDGSLEKRDTASWQRKSWVVGVVSPKRTANVVKFIGNVPAKPPAGGTLRHKGWRAAKVDLPALSARQDAAVIAPAEIEIE